MPATRRSSSAAIAGAGSRHEPSRSICVSSSPAATSAASRARSLPPVPVRSISSKTNSPRRRAPGARPNSARAGKAHGLGVAGGERDDDAAAGHALQRGAERRAADALDHRVVGRVVAGEVEDDLRGAELAQPAGALGVARHRGDARARARGELHREAPDPAAGAGHEHALAEHEAADLQRAQRGDAGDRQRRGLREAHAVGQLGEVRRRHRDALAPTRRCARSRRRARPAAARCRRRRPARRRRRRPSPAPSPAGDRAAGAIRRGSARTP